jgi:hypothetical protein
MTIIQKVGQKGEPMSDRKIIYADDAIDAITNYGKFLWDNFHETCNLAGMIDAIRNLPSAQSKQKKGKWHRRFYPQVEMMVCSECQEEFSYDAETGVRDYNYCPNCGAYMRGEEDE